MRAAGRLDRIQPYPFSELERKIEQKQREGVDVISLGIGDPDRPTPPHVVEAMASAVRDPSTHGYPSNRGRASFREAVASFYRVPVRRDARPRDPGAAGARRQGVHLPPQLRLPRPRRPGAGERPGLPRLHRRPAAGRRGAPAAAAAAREGVCARPRRDRRRFPRARAAAFPELSEQPDRGGGAGRASSRRPSRSPASTIFSSSTTTPTRRSASTATSLPASSRPRERWTWGSRSFRSRRATT